ncbi:MAG: YicC/YloC family endoribonuclease [Rikenellaceae bacterium]
MVKSMTGYGKGEANSSSKKITVEIRTLNSKQADVSVRIPSIYRQAEYDIRNKITKSLQRGKIDVAISFAASETAQTNASINKEVFASYYNEFKSMIQELNPDKTFSDQVESAIVSSILRMPEVVKSEVTEVSKEELQALTEAADAALVHINEFRVQEGKILIDDLLARVDKIEAYMNEVTPFEKLRTEVVKKRILDGLESLKVPIDSNRLEQEMIFYIEKLDITEEKTRLTNHCNYFRQVSAEEEGVGRKLGFISQEMGREINTMGSKANNADIQKLVVKMKDELEKIKEQLLNIL